jgi:hypothetical protein
MNPSFIYRNISLLYRSLEEIQKNIGYVARRGNSVSENRRAGNAHPNERAYVINNDQRFMIENYGKMYDTILRHIEFLYSQLLFIPHPQNPHFNRPNNLVYFNGHYYTVHPTEQTPLSEAQPLQQQQPLQQPLQQQHVLRPHAPNYIPSSPIHPPDPPATPNLRQSTSVRFNPHQRSLSTPTTMFTRTMGNFSDPVNVIATPEQIARATRNILYENVEEPLNDRCPICLDVFQSSSEVTQIRHCGHVFNRSQLATWLERNVRCPVCRFDIRDHVSAPPHNDIDQQPVQTNEPSSNPTSPISAGGSVANALSNALQTQLTEMLGTFASETLHDILHDTNNISTSQILTNLFNHNIENLSYDASANTMRFDTYIYPPRR